MATILLSGTLDGAGDVLGAAALIYGLQESVTGSGGVTSPFVRMRLCSGVSLGQGDITGVPIRTMIFGGQAYGSGTVADQLDIVLSGALVGTGALTGTLIRMLGVRGLVLTGSGDVSINLPLPLQGFGNVAGYIEVQRFVCPRVPPPPKAFRWGQTLGPGDLTLDTLEPMGLPYSPIVVLYSLYFIPRGGAKMLMGPPNRRPAQKDIGRYYATATLGECGQPGCWMIQWRWQRFWYDAPCTREEYFQVQDAVLAGPIDFTQRSCKKGWL